MQTHDNQTSSKPPIPALAPPCPECGQPMHPRATMLTPADVTYVCIVCAWRGVGTTKSPQTLQG